MGQTGSRTNFRQAVIDLTSKPSKPGDDSFWEQLWSGDNVQKASDIFWLVPTSDIRQLRDENPNNLATLCFKAIEKLQEARDNPSTIKQTKVINCVRLLTRILPYMFEDPEWRGYFWSTIPNSDSQIPLASCLLGVLSDLLFCLGFTIAKNDGGPEKVDDLAQIDSCEYIWEAGVGCATRPSSTAQMDQNRTEILKLLLTCLSEVIYMPLNDEQRLRWTMHFSAAENRHVLPLFTSLLNTVCSYDPVGMGMPYNYLLFSDTREPLVEACLQLLIACLDRDSAPKSDETGYADNYFIHFLSRIHRDEDFEFMLKGITRLLQNPLQSGYLPNSTKKVNFHQELLVLLWKCCEYNQKFLLHVLKTSDVLELLVPILYHICDARNDQSRVGLVHMCVFIILLLSGERNFGVRLNKPYVGRAPIDIQAVNGGTHADLLILVFHKLITTGNHRMQSLFDCLLTVVVNVSPYLKSLSMTAANKLVHLVEAFSTPWFLFSSATNHHLVFFLLEVFNNIIQYQFDGNSNLIYTIIRKRQVFYQLANLTTDASSIAKSLSGRKGKGGRTEIVDQLKSPTAVTSPELPGSVPVSAAAAPVAGLAATPQMSTMTDKLPTDTSAPTGDDWVATSEWAEAWKAKLPLQTIMRLLQVLVPQVEKICIDKGLTDETEILKFLQHGTLVGLLPVPHPILIRKYQANAGTNHWFRTYMWGVIYLRNVDPPIWYDTSVKLFEINKT